MLTIMEKVDLLQNVEMFRGIRTQSLARVAAIAQEVDFEPQRKLFAEHEAADALFVILEGAVSLSRGAGGSVEAGRSQVAGAFSLLADQPHAETAVVTLPARLLRIGQQDLFDAMSEDFGVTRGILRALVGAAAGPISSHPA